MLAQRWAEGKRRLLIITPANLRKQWHQELSEKFGLPCRILESRSYRDAVQQGTLRPFESDASLVICSHQFARSKADDVRATPWDLVVRDEAHRLRIEHPEYVPDFVAETDDAVMMLEVKARNEVDDSIVLAKRDAAEQWCRHATEYSVKHGGKPWRYGLIAHDLIADNMSVDALILATTSTSTR